MSPSVRVLVDILVRSAALLGLSQGVAAIYSAMQPDDDGLGAGLTVMMLLVCAGAAWGLWDGFRRSPAQLCITWILTGLLVSLGTTLYSMLRYDGWSWSVLASDLSSGLVFWAGLLFVPAICAGILPSAQRADRRSGGVLPRASS